MRSFGADLHIHTALSPCAAPEMTPPAIVAQARRKGLELIAICDHNSASNAAATQRAARAEPSLAVLAGIELSTREEAHVVGLFPCAEAALLVGAAARATLPQWREHPSWMGEQRLLGKDGRRLGREPKMLAAATTLSLPECVALIHAHAGLAIAAHVDRPSFSVTSQLGLVPTDVAWDALELSAAGAAAGRAREYASLGLPLLASSDSHSLDEIGETRSWLTLREPSFAELALALAAQGGRRCALA